MKVALKMSGKNFCIQFFCVENELVFFLIDIVSYNSNIKLEFKILILSVQIHKTFFYNLRKL